MNYMDGEQRRCGLDKRKLVCWYQKSQIKMLGGPKLQIWERYLSPHFIALNFYLSISFLSAITHAALNFPLSQSLPTFLTYNILSSEGLETR